MLVTVQVYRRLYTSIQPATDNGTGANVANYNIIILQCSSWFNNRL